MLQSVVCFPWTRLRSLLPGSGPLKQASTKPNLCTLLKNLKFIHDSKNLNSYMPCSVVFLLNANLSPRFCLLPLPHLCSHLLPGIPKTLTPEGLDFTFATNYVGPFLLTNLLQGKEEWGASLLCHPCFSILLAFSWLTVPIATSFHLAPAAHCVMTRYAFPPHTAGQPS